MRLGTVVAVGLSSAVFLCLRGCASAAERALPDVPGLAAFDFGPTGSTEWPGFKAVTGTTVFTVERGYGWRGGPPQGNTPYPVDSLARGQIGWDSNAYRESSSPEFEFSVRVPNGDYLLAVIATNPVPLRSYYLKAEGKPLVEGVLSLKNIYTAEHYYRLMRIAYRPDGDPFDRLVVPLVPVQRGEVSVADGELTLTARRLGIHMLLVAPASSREAFDRYLNVLHELRRKEWHDAKHYDELLPDPDFDGPVPTPDDAQRGYITFTRSYQEEIYPNTRPGPHEISRPVRLSAARGETEPAVVAVYPLRDLGVVTATITDLSGPGGATIGAKHASVRAVGYFEKRFRPRENKYAVVPFVLGPGNSAEACVGLARPFWLTVAVPEDATPGDYRGEVRFSSGKGGQAAVPVELHVRSFTLPTETKKTLGWYYRGPTWKHEGYRMIWLGKEAEPLMRQTLRQELLDQMAHGFNATQLPEARVTKVLANGKVEVDFSELDLFIPVMKEVGLGLKNENLIFTLSAANDILSKGQLKEFSPEFNVAFKDYLVQLRDYLKKRDVRALFWLVDEPREVRQNAWNRNIADTMHYLRLAREVPDIRITVTLQASSRDGKDYTGAVPLMDVLQTHPAQVSLGNRRAAQRAPNTELWLFNSGKNNSRFCYGFFAWANGITGRFQWHYNYADRPWNRFCDFVGDSWGVSQVVFRSPEGPVATTWYEWAREGVDDIRYTELAESLIAQAEKSGREEARAAARKARTELDAIRAEVPESAPMEVILGRDGFAYRGKWLTKQDEWRERVAAVIQAITAELRR